jgi:cytochrome c553
VVPHDTAETDQKAHMRKHFAAVSELQRAIARGHLDDAHELAGWLTGHAEPLQEGWEPYVDELQAAARDVSTAGDLPTAAALAARLGRACSRCHEARDAIVSFSWAPAPDETPMLASQMKRHQWAAARLWEGLVGPADQLWKEGADVLSHTKLDVAQAAELNRGDVAALAGRVRELAKRAGTVTDHDERAKLFGEMLSTCAGCHQLVRPQPVPDP